jgi:hypothetical protein
MIIANELPGDDERRPYAPAANVVAVLDRVRRVNLPDVIDNGVLRLAGVSEGAMGRVNYALRFLGLVDPNGRPTDRLRALARAGEDEGRDLLAAVVREAYAADFARLDPAQDTQPRIVSAFQRYEPRSQIERMVMLFLGLCRAAGIPVLDPPRERGIQPGRAAPRGTNGGRAPRSRERSADRPASRLRSPDPEASFDTAPRDSLIFDLHQLDLIEDEDEFKEVWEALGKARRIVGRARRAANDAHKADQAEGEAQGEGE